MQTPKNNGSASDALNESDRSFLKEMVPHHDAAVKMAKNVIAHGSSEKVKSLAEGIIKSQSAEISEMTEWLKDSNETPDVIMKMSRATIIASTNAEFKPALTLGQGLPPEVQGQPAAYFWKEALFPGNYQDRNGTKFTIDAKRVDNLIQNFSRAKANGFTPRVPDGHTASAKANMGFILDARKNSRGGLELLHQMIGDDAIKAVSRNKTSICTVANAIDEHGNEYDELIDHNALVPDPQLNNLTDFVPALAASRGATANAVVLTLAASQEQESIMDLKHLREAIGAANEVSDEQLIANAVAKLTENASALQLSKTASTDLTAAITRAEQAEAKVLELSRTPDLDVLTDRAALKSERIDLAMERGQCTKAQADLLKGALKDGDKPAVLMLSKMGTVGTPVDLMLKVLELNKPFTGLSLSGAQRLPDPNAVADSLTQGQQQGADFQTAQLKARGLAS